MNEIVIQLNALHLVLAIISIVISFVGTIGFQIGIYWKFRKDVEITLRQHEDKIRELDKAREKQGMTLTEIKVSTDYIKENITVLFEKIDMITKKLDN